MHHRRALLVGLADPFSPSSAWNNFDFGHSSKLERKARLDIGTLGPRDVYVYIKTDNMPSELPPEGDAAATAAAHRNLSAAAKERMGALGALVPAGSPRKRRRR